MLSAPALLRRRTTLLVLACLVPLVSSAAGGTCLVGEVLKRYGVSLDAINFWDEPPGKINEATFKKNGQEILLVLEYDPRLLFQWAKDWHKESVLSAVVKYVLTDDKAIHAYIDGTLGPNNHIDRTCGAEHADD